MEYFCLQTSSDIKKATLIQYKFQKSCWRVLTFSKFVLYVEWRVTLKKHSNFDVLSPLMICILLSYSKRERLEVSFYYFSFLPFADDPFDQLENGGDNVSQWWTSRSLNIEIHRKLEAIGITEISIGNMFRFYRKIWNLKLFGHSCFVFNHFGFQPLFDTYCFISIDKNKRRERGVRLSVYNHNAAMLVPCISMFEGHAMRSTYTSYVCCSFSGYKMRKT